MTTISAPCSANGASDQDIEERIRAMVTEKEAGHRINEPGFVPPSLDDGLHRRLGNSARHAYARLLLHRMLSLR